MGAFTLTGACYLNGTQTIAVTLLTSSQSGPEDDSFTAADGFGTGTIIGFPSDGVYLTGSSPEDPACSFAGYAVKPPFTG